MFRSALGVTHPHILRRSWLELGHSDHSSNSAEVQQRLLELGMLGMDCVS